MKPKHITLLVLVLLATLVVGVIGASAADEDLIRLTIINRTDRFVFLSLLSEDGTQVYFLATPSEQTREYTVPRSDYSHTTVACGLTATGTVDLNRFTTLIFTPCGRTPANSGEPSFEKIFLFDSPVKSDFYYQME
jgi:hypothetical protein